MQIESLRCCCDGECGDAGDDDAAVVLMERMPFSFEFFSFSCPGFVYFCLKWALIIQFKEMSI